MTRCRKCDANLDAHRVLAIGRCINRRCKWRGLWWEATRDGRRTAGVSEVAIASGKVAHWGAGA